MIKTKNFLKYMTLLLLITIVGCDAKEQVSKNIHPVQVQLAKGINAKVAVGYDENRRFKLIDDASVNRLFDNKTDTWWTSEERGCEKVGISVELERPTYFKKVSILHHGKVFPLIGSLTVAQSADEDSHEVWSHGIHLSTSSNQVLDISGDYYPLVLKGGVFILFLKNCNVAKARLEISDIKFEFSDTPTLKPILSAKEINTAVKSMMKPNGKNWHFVDDEKESNKEKYLAHLMYYGSLGDIESDKLFKSYNPSASDLSEDQSALESWYEEDNSGSFKN